MNLFYRNQMQPNHKHYGKAIINKSLNDRKKHLRCTISYKEIKGSNLIITNKFSLQIMLSMNFHEGVIASPTLTIKPQH